MRTALLVVLISLFAVMTEAFAGLPSDSIFYRTMPSEPLRLSGVDPSVPAAFAAENEIGPYTDWQMPNYGHYYAGKISAVQKDEGTDKTLLKFANETTTIDNVSANFTAEIPYL